MLTSAPRLIWVVAAALIDGAGRVLMQQRPPGQQHGGLWEFPGGKIEPGETPEAALVRELDEELGIAVAEDALAPVSFSTAPPVVLLLYRCSAWVGAPRAIEGAALQWAEPAALAELPILPADRPLLALLPRA